MVDVKPCDAVNMQISQIPQQKPDKKIWHHAKNS